MKKVLSFILACVMLFSFCTFDIYAYGKAETKTPTFYGELTAGTGDPTTAMKTDETFYLYVKWKDNPTDWEKGWSQSSIWVRFDNTKVKVTGSSLTDSTIVMGEPDEEDEENMLRVPGSSSVSKSSAKIATENGDFGFTMSFNYPLIQDESGTVGKITFKAVADFDSTDFIIVARDVYSARIDDGVYRLTDDMPCIETIAQAAHAGVAHTHTMTHTKAKAATCEKTGTNEYWYCSGCEKYFYNAEGTSVIDTEDVDEYKTIAKIPHNMTHHEAVPAKCDSGDGNVEYWSCDICKKNYSDEEGKNVIANVKVARPPHIGDKVSAVNATCLRAGNRQYYHCTVCQKNYATLTSADPIDDVTIAKKAHVMTKHPAFAATCLKEGSVGYWSCSLCQKLYADAKGTIEITDTVVPKLSHVMTHHTEKAATCCEDGNIEYWSCELCQKNFADEAGTNVLADVTILKDANNHAGGTEIRDASSNYTGDTYCKECGELLETGTVIPCIDASGECGDNLTWSLSGTELTISGTGDMWDYDPLYASAPWYGKGITSVTLEDGVTGIGDYAFCYCRNLTSITIPNGVTSIGESAFSGCESLGSIILPLSVRSIGAYAFSGCGFASIVIPQGITSIGGYAFESCYGLETVYYTGTYNQWSYDKIRNCFDDYYITVVYNAASSGKCGDNLTWELYGSFLTISGTGDMRDYDSKYNSSTGRYETTAPWGKKITSVTIGNGVTSIGKYTFYGCKSLTSITIPRGVTSIGDFAFENCVNLTSITIPDSVTSIGDEAFAFCYSLTSITIPDSVTSIGEAAFYDCYNLTSVTIGNGITSIGYHAFGYCSSLTSITIPRGVTSIVEYAFSCCTGIESITVSSGNKNYHSDGNCLIETGTKTLILGCKNSVIPSDGSVTSIGNSAFGHCSSLTSITIPDSVTSIGDSAFYDCSGLTSVTIGNGVTSIGSYAFCGCSNLTSITIPDSVTSIGRWAFSDCYNLKTVYYTGTMEQWNNISKENCGLSDDVTVVFNYSENPETGGGLTFYAELSTTSADHGGEVVATIKWKNNPSDWGKGWAQGTVWVKFDNTVLEIDKSSVEGSTIVMGKPDEDDEDIINPVSGVAQMAKSSKRTANENGEFGFQMAFSYLLVQAETGTVGTVTFKVKDDATYADTTVTVEPDGLYSSTGPDGRYDSASMDEETYTGDAATLTVEVPKCTHANKTHTAAKAATCDEAGNIAYWTCNDCGKKFSDEACTTEVADVTVNKLSHSMTYIAAVDGTCENDGNVDYWYCSECQRNYGDEDGAAVLASVIVKKHPHSMTHHVAVPATCISAGNKEYWACSECHKNYGDEAGTTVLSNVTVAKHAHSMTHYTAVSATCKEAGNVEYWACSECHKNYSDQAGTSVLTSVVEAVNPDNHVGETELRDAKAATCCEDGYTGDTYCKDCGEKIATGSAIPATGIHEDTDGKWETDGTSHWHTCYFGTKFDVASHTGGTATCKDKAVCSVCGVSYGSKDAHNHVGETELRDIKAATCCEDGYTGNTYCVSCDEKIAEGVVISATGHIYDNYSDRTCNKCGYERNVVTVAVESKKAVAGKEFTVSVNIEDNPGIMYLELTPGYDKGLTLTGVTNGELISDFTHVKQYIWVVSDKDTHENGTLMTFTFRTSKDLTPGEYEVGFTARGCYNYDEESVALNIAPGTIEVIDFIYGDVNDDEVINGQDVVRLTKYLANYNYDTDTCEIEIGPGADCNGDGVINGQDIMRLKKYLANYDYDTNTCSVVLGPQ